MSESDSGSASVDEPNNIQNDMLVAENEKSTESLLN